MGLSSKCDDFFGVQLCLFSHNTKALWNLLSTHFSSFNTKKRPLLDRSWSTARSSYRSICPARHKPMGELERIRYYNRVVWRLGISVVTQPMVGSKVLFFVLLKEEEVDCSEGHTVPLYCARTRLLHKPYLS
jgi:hypothetical protein